jgi:hypothetical protein
MTGEMSPMGRGDEAASLEELRASHEDRDRVVDLLRVAAGDGRLTSDELDERLDKALTARTFGELAALTRDLPPVGGLAAGAPIPAPKDEIRIECGSASTKRDGRWVVPRRITVRLNSGTVTLDFTRAVIVVPSLEIDANVRSGTLKLVTKPGISVDADDVSIRSGKVKVRTPWDADTPAILRIQVSGSVSSGGITAGPPRPPRRTLWQWLLRRPRRKALPPPAAQTEGKG